MGKTIVIIALSSILTGLNCYFNLLSNWVVILIAVVVFIFYVEFSMDKDVRSQFYESCLLAILGFSPLILAILGYFLSDIYPWLLQYKWLGSMAFVFGGDLVYPIVTHTVGRL